MTIEVNWNEIRATAVAAGADDPGPRKGRLILEPFVEEKLDLGEYACDPKDDPWPPLSLVAENKHG